MVLPERFEQSRFTGFQWKHLRWDLARGPVHRDKAAMNGAQLRCKDEWATYPVCAILATQYPGSPTVLMEVLSCLSLQI